MLNVYEEENRQEFGVGKVKDQVDGRHLWDGDECQTVLVQLYSTKDGNYHCRFVPE